MNTQRRRGPQAKRRKVKRPASTAPRERTAALPAVKTPNLPASKSSFLKGLPSLLTKSPTEMKASIRTVRQWSSQMRGTMAEMEQTLDTLTNLLGMYDRWNESSKTRSTLRAAAKTTGEKSSIPLSFMKTLNTVDFRQIISLLNSPLVQALLEMDESAASDENKEG
ncbi:hypothetical protein [Aneurinibacillus tyrosinisolvens]|uniref:hypothetical protein n=1 Tax=Aneurinibacillus tyrosinisolvens TaxID=1443435 RepID=UPI00128B9C08|nr:hypothetical protein [Aneurinibacillus tyrosinisolvens]